MPDPFERHGRSDDRGPVPSRSQLRRMAAVDDDAKRPAARKDPALCKAARWKGPHQPGLRQRQPLPGKDAPCHWDASWSGDEARWSCWHEEACSGCGRILRASIEAEECPQFRPMTAEDRASVAAEIERHHDHRAALAARRPVITGPQGYRRKRSA